MSIKCMTTVWEKSKHKGGNLLLLLAIADNANDDIWHAWPGMSTLAKKTRRTERTIRNQIPEIEASGELIVYRKEGQVNHYLITTGLTKDEVEVNLRAFCTKLGITPEDISSPRTEEKTSGVPRKKLPGRGEAGFRGTPEIAISPESSKNHQTEPSENHQSSEPADAGPDDSPQRPSPVENPEAYSVPEIQALKLTRSEWEQLLRNERQGRGKHGVRSGVVRHIEHKLSMHPLEPLMPAMLEAVDKATVQSVHDPGMAAQFRKVIYDKLWQGERPYLPDEILQFAAEESPVENIYFLPSVLSGWRGKQKAKGKASNGSQPPGEKKPKYPQYNRNDALERIEQRRRAAEAAAGGDTNGGV